MFKFAIGFAIFLAWGAFQMVDTLMATAAVAGVR